MELIGVLLIGWLIWSLLNSGRSTPNRERLTHPRSVDVAPSTPPTPSRYPTYVEKVSSPAPTQDAIPSNPRRKHSTTGPCICGCGGRPLTDCAENSVDYSLYRDCPARWSRKYRHSDERAQKRRSIQVKEAEKRQAAKTIEQATKKKKAEALKLLSLAEEQQRDRLGQPAKSAAEALRRGLDTYIGNACNISHDGTRFARNGECIHCKRSDQRIRDAMRRGAYPRDLTSTEKQAIHALYERAKSLTKETGIPHHVDHIKPLAAGGEHHPDNLQILTAEENLRKGSKWATSQTARRAEDSRSKNSIATHARDELSRESDHGAKNTSYRGLGVGRRDSIRD